MNATETKLMAEVSQIRATISFALYDLVCLKPSPSRIEDVEIGDGLLDDAAESLKQAMNILGKLYADGTGTSFHKWL